MLTRVQAVLEVAGADSAIQLLLLMLPAQNRLLQILIGKRYLSTVSLNPRYRVTPEGTLARLL
jgi:hypothetical protein